MTIDAGSWLQAAGALAVVIALLVLAARGWRWGGLGDRQGRRLAVQDVLALDSRRRVLILRCDGRDVLLLTGGGQDVLLGWLAARDDAA